MNFFNGKYDKKIDQINFPLNTPNESFKRVIKFGYKNFVAFHFKKYFNYIRNVFNH